MAVRGAAGVAAGDALVHGPALDRQQYAVHMQRTAAWHLRRIDILAHLARGLNTEAGPSFVHLTAPAMV